MINLKKIESNYFDDIQTTLYEKNIGGIKIANNDFTPSYLSQKEEGK